MYSPSRVDITLCSCQVYLFCSYSARCSLTTIEYSVDSVLTKSPAILHACITVFLQLNLGRPISGTFFPGQTVRIQDCR